MSETENAPQPSDERQSNRVRRPKIRKTARANFPLMTAPPAQPAEQRREASGSSSTGLDTSDPSAGGGRSFYYEWEVKYQQLQDQITNGGGGGGPGVSFTYTQSVAAATWVIDHHLGLIPSVVLVDNTGQQLIAEIRHPSDQTTVIYHSAPYAGKAYLRS